MLNWYTGIVYSMYSRQFCMEGVHNPQICTTSQIEEFSNIFTTWNLTFRDNGKHAPCFAQIPSQFSPACFPFQHRKVLGDILNLKEKRELAKKVRKNSVPRAWGMLQLFRVDCTNRLLWSPWVESLVMAAVSPGVSFQRRISQIPSRIVRFYPELVDFCSEYLHMDHHKAA